nr:MAG: replication-associated protein [Cressdnaviricota sp.]
MSQLDPICIDDSSDSGDDLSLSHGSGLSAHSIRRRCLENGELDYDEKYADGVGSEQPGTGGSDNRSVASDGEDTKFDPSEVGISVEPRPSVKRGKDAYNGKRFRWWFFTWNNPSHPEEKERLLSIYGTGKRFVKFQYEKGKNGTLHYQGVLYNDLQITCSALLKRHPGLGYLAPCKSIAGAVEYCGKEDSRVDGPWEAGTLPAQGKRSDLLECKSIIDGGGGMAELYEQQFSNAIRYGRGLSQYVSHVNRDKVRTWQTVCYAYYGEAGTGKTEAAKIESAKWGGGTFWLTLEGGTGGKVWWDGYNGEENIIIDEFNNQMKFADFKRLIDSSPLKIPYKGGYTNFLGKRVWVLSNTHIDWWYHHAARDAHRGALTRRLHYSELFDTKFQGAPDYDSFVDIREWFVELQKTGEVKIL